jgi:hypothetical protein
LGLDATLTTLLSKKITVAKSEDVETGRSNSRQSWHNLLSKAMPKKKGCFANDDDMQENTCNVIQ